MAKRRQLQRQHEEHSAEALFTFSQTVDWNVEPIDEALRPEGLAVPISIFSGELPALQAIVRHLRDRDIPFAEIALLLGRSESTIRATWRAVRDVEAPLVETSLEMPLSYFSLGLSPLETVVCFLFWNGLRNVDVAALLGLDPRTTSTVKRRIALKGVVR